MTHVRQHLVYRASLDCDIDHLIAIRAPVPAISRVNWDSRNQATATVLKEFHTIIKNRPIYFDYEKDTLLFDTNATLNWFLGNPVNVALERRSQAEIQLAERQ